MKKILSLAMVIGLLMGSLLAYAEEKVKRGGLKAPDELQQSYYDRMITINRSIWLAEKHRRMYNDLRNRLNYSYSSASKLADEYNKEIDQAHKDKEKYENEKAYLKMDALKYYNGKLPDWLKQTWEEDENWLQAELKGEH